MNTSYDSRKEKSASLLLDAIGGIDDRYVFEAAPPISVRRGINIRKLVLVAACVILSVAVLSAYALGTLLGSSKDEEAGDANGIYTESADKNYGTNDMQAPSSAPTVLTLSQTFISIKDSTASLSTSEESIDLFDGSAKIIWKYSDEDDYRVCKISGNTRSELRASLFAKKDFTLVSSAESDTAFEGIWICFGDGLVYSPCLKNSSENIGYGVIFDYDPELEPSKDFTSLLIAAIEDSQ